MLNSSFTQIEDLKLNTILNNHLHLDKEYVTTNSNTLTNELIKRKINNQYRLLTLDVKDLYVNIPIRETIEILRTQLLTNNDRQTTNQIIALLEIILGQNCVSFQGQIYQLDKGVAMGSPISGTIAEISLQQLEKSHIKHLMDSNNLVFYTRYVRDILIVNDSTLITPERILQYIDTIHSNIQLNPTQETNSNICFMDLSITRKPSCLEIGIYRKPTATTSPSTFSPTIHSNTNLQPTNSSLEECLPFLLERNDRRNGSTYYKPHTTTTFP